jgi:hypothetical protein
MRSRPRGEPTPKALLSHPTGAVLNKNIFSKNVAFPRPPTSALTGTSDRSPRHGHRTREKKLAARHQ